MLAGIGIFLNGISRLVIKFCGKYPQNLFGELPDAMFQS
jgi:hypothetical protein